MVQVIRSANGILALVLAFIVAPQSAQVGEWARTTMNPPRLGRLRQLATPSDKWRRRLSLTVETGLQGSLNGSRRLSGDSIFCEPFNYPQVSLFCGECGGNTLWPKFLDRLEYSANFCASRLSSVGDLIGML